MLTVNMHDAKSQLSKLVEAAISGEEVVIARNGMPTVKLVPVCTRDASRRIGGGRAILGASMDDLSLAAFTESDAEIEALFYGEDDK